MARGRRERFARLLDSAMGLSARFLVGRLEACGAGPAREQACRLRGRWVALGGAVPQAASHWTWGGDVPPLLGGTRDLEAPQEGLPPLAARCHRSARAGVRRRACSRRTLTWRRQPARCWSLARRRPRGVAVAAAYTDGRVFDGSDPWLARGGLVAVLVGPRTVPHEWRRAPRARCTLSQTKSTSTRGRGSWRKPRRVLPPPRSWKARAGTCGGGRSLAHRGVDDWAPRWALQPGCACRSKTAAAVRRRWSASGGSMTCSHGRRRRRRPPPGGTHCAARSRRDGLLCRMSVACLLEPSCVFCRAFRGATRSVATCASLRGLAWHLCTERAHCTSSERLEFGAACLLSGEEGMGRAPSTSERGIRFCRDSPTRIAELCAPASARFGCRSVVRGCRHLQRQQRALLHRTSVGVRTSALAGTHG